MGFKTKEEEEFISHLDQIRQNLGINPAEMARRLGIKHSDYNRIQRGKRKLYLYEFSKVYRAIGPDPFAKIVNNMKLDLPVVEEGIEPP